MDIRNIRELKNTAAQRLDQAAEAKKIVLIYSLIGTVTGLLVTLITYCLDLQMDQLGGLSQMGKKSLLSTIGTVLPMVANMALLCLDLGFMAAMLRIGREMYTSVRTLRAGIPRFWAMLRTQIALYGIYFVLGMGAFYLATAIFVLLPVSDSAMDMILPMVSTMDPATLVLDPALEAQLTDALLPLFVIVGIVALVLVLPVTYHYRMTNFVLLHNPHAGALMALRESKKMMRGNRLALLKIDLSLWWYYGLSLLSMAVCYGGEILTFLGIVLPMSDTVSFFLFYILSLGMVFATNILFRNKTGVMYAMFFDAVRPREEENSGGVVLGNIFQM